MSQTPSYASSDTSIAESESKFNTKTVLLDEIQLLENDKTTKETNLNEWLILNFQVRKYMKHRTKREQHQQSFYDQDEDNKDDDDNDDDDDDDDDNSSQFSFVHDMKGGRNTSVKYYKTKNSKNTNNDEGLLNTFNELDLGYEVDEFSDYDYENNGVIWMMNTMILADLKKMMKMKTTTSILVVIWKIRMMMKGFFIEVLLIIKVLNGM